MEEAEGVRISWHRDESRRLVTDLDAWFAALDRFADVPFMDDGREQPPLPPDDDLFG